ncbi:uL15 family ribosomal protein [Candidatus Woesearchaeota archaeon]|nr:uL15 family ribosomal protein [Candidatus Woesearchaeota archaeon]
MVVHRRRKHPRMRGKTHHGWGAKKKHRGAGHRGGRGNAGSGKRCASKKPSYWKDPHYLGKYGFIKHNVKYEVEPITIRALEEKLPHFVKEGKVTQENSVHLIDLATLGYNKLLGTGSATKKMKITSKFASAKAVEKIKAAGGDVILSSKAE